MRLQPKKRSSAVKANQKGQKRQKSRNAEDQNDGEDTFFLDDEKEAEQIPSDEEEEEVAETAEAKRLRLGTESAVL